MSDYKKAEGILDKYSKGKLSATEVQKQLKKFGLGASLRGKGNIIPVYPLDGGDGFDVELAKGGAMLNKQMELFEPVEGAFNDGGLMDEGGTVDPVSGNDVPTGSTQKEVRDDIPAQLSEGEFVLPADVVRYHGLEKIMELRDEAKAGLQKMEDMGQMGNSEEAILPDDVPFTMDDLEIEDDGVPNFQVGGFMPPQNVSFQQSQFAGYQPQYQQYQQPQAPTTQPSTYQAPQQQFTPTMQGPVPNFQQFTQPTTVTYYHADGRTLQIPVDANGNPLIPVPAGFSTSKPQASTTPTTGAATGTGTGAPQTFISEGGDPSPEQQKQQEEYKALVNTRKDAAKKLGYTKEQSAGDVLFSLLPGAGMFAGNPEKGTILADGTIADGEGRSFDPVTGEQVGFEGGIMGSIAGGLGLKDKATPEGVAKNIPEASYAGLMSVAGNQSIEDLLAEAGKKPKADEPDMQSEYQKAAGVGVETTLETQEGTAGEVAQKAAESQRTDVTPITPDFATTTRTRPDTPTAAGEFADVQRPSRTTPVDADEFADTAAPTPVDASEFQDPLRDFGGKGPDVSRAAAQQAGEEKREQARQAAIETERFAREASRSKAESAKREATVAGHAARYESEGYSPSAARAAAVNKTDADNEARQQTNNPNASAVTSSSGKAVRSSSGNVVVSGSSVADDGGGDDSGGKIVCTEMYRQTQLDDWKQAIKIWGTYEKKYLTKYHEIGYHWLFKPYVRGMQNSNILTQLGAYLAQERTKHLKHVMTKGRAKDSLVGNVWCKIIHPIVYVAGRIKNG